MNVVTNSNPEFADVDTGPKPGAIWADAISYGAFVDGEFCDRDTIDAMRKFDGDFWTAVHLMGLPELRMVAVTRMCFELSGVTCDPDSTSYRELFIELALLDESAEKLGFTEREPEGIAGAI